MLACKVAALQREVSGTKIIQKLEVQYAIGDNVANACFGSTSMETVGIGNTEGQAMTSALRNIKTTPMLKAIVRKARQSIINYYDKNGHVVTGTQVIQGVTFNFGSDGALLVNGTGIDVSKYQGVIDWEQVKNAGVDL